MISERKKEILLCGIEQFIGTGEPIVSGKLEKLGLNYSSATIRNELAELEEQGFLKQLHTSGGRIPTEKGYIAYVSNLATKIPMEEGRLDKVEKGFLTKTNYLSELIETVARTVSKASNLPSAVMLDGFENIKVKNIKIVPLISNQCFVLIETEIGIIDPIFINVKTVNEKICADASACLTSNFKDQPLKTLISEIDCASQTILKDIADFQEIFTAVVTLLKQSIDRYKSSVVSSGTSSLLNVKEYKESEKAKALIDFIENDDEFKETLNSGDTDKKMEFKFGEVSGEGYGLVQTKCIINGVNIGSLAVVGPQRMDYLKIASALQYISKELENEKGENK